MCLIFTNLEPKLMILVFEAMADPANVRSLICRFNLIHYGSLLLVYPIIVLTNFNRLFFLLLSIIFLPQIYLNGINGTRPDPASKYYRHFLLYRFVLVVIIVPLSSTSNASPIMSSASGRTSRSAWCVFACWPCNTRSSTCRSSTGPKRSCRASCCPHYTTMPTRRRSTWKRAARKWSAPSA